MGNKQSKKVALGNRNFKELDLIFMGSNDSVSKCIRCVEACIHGKADWSHVGLVISKKYVHLVYPNDDPEDTLYIWEAILSSTIPLICPEQVLDADSKTSVFGVQVRKLDDVIKGALSSGQRVGYGKLLNNPVYIDPLLIMNKTKQLYREYYHRGFEDDPGECACACLPCNCHCCGDTNVFCSEFVSHIYQELDIMGRQFDPSKIMPQDFVNPETSTQELDRKFVDEVIEITV